MTRAVSDVKLKCLGNLGSWKAEGGPERRTVKFFPLQFRRFAPRLAHVSDETTSTSEGSHGAPSNFSNQASFKKKKAKKDGIGNLFMMMAVLGIIASLVSVVLSMLFTANS